MGKDSNKKTKKNKNTYTILGIIFILFVFSIVTYFMSKTYAIDDFGTVSISCDKEEIKKDDIVSCTITGNVIGTSEVSSLEMQVTLSSNLEFQSFTKDSSWEGDEEDGNIQLYAENNKEGTFPIGIIQFKVNNAIYNSTESIQINNIVFYKGNDDDFEGISINSVSKEFDTPTIEFQNLNVKESSKIVYKIPIDTKVSSLTSKVIVNGTVTVKNKKDQVVDSDDILKTGYNLVITIGGETINYKISVLGDTTGDGVLLINDIGKAYQYLKGKLNMPEECVLAGEVTKDGEIQINDIGKMYQYLKGKLNSLG